MAPNVAARQRKLGVHVSLDLETLERLDAEAAKAGVSRSELVRQIIWVELGKTGAETCAQEQA
jgi:metal-responsive CopG/Arc/MetJ family transcriptional regulator